MAATEKKMRLIDQLRARNLVDTQMTIQHAGEPINVTLPRTLQWAALAATHPQINDLIQFKESDSAHEVDDDEMCANVVGLALALQQAKEDAIEEQERTGIPAPKYPMPTPESIEEFVTLAAGMNPLELEQGFLTIFYESHQTHKRLFLASADRVADLVANPDAAAPRKAPTTRKRAPAKPRAKRATSTT